MGCCCSADLKRAEITLVRSDLIEVNRELSQFGKNLKHTEQELSQLKYFVFDIEKKVKSGEHKSDKLIRKVNGLDDRITTISKSHKELIGIVTARTRYYPYRRNSCHF